MHGNTSKRRLPVALKSEKRANSGAQISAPELPLLTEGAELLGLEARRVKKVPVALIGINWILFRSTDEFEST
jgi:hypothetical protein